MIYTKSQFYYGIEIDENNNKLDFEESGTPLVGTVTVGFYSLEDFATELTLALARVTLGLAYTATVDRTSRKVTISADGSFDIITDGVNSGLSAWGEYGFTANQTGAASYESDSAVGDVYRPQYLLQQYVPFENYIDSVEGSVKQSTSGEVEVVSFGTARRMQCEIDFITNRTMPSGAPVDNNATGLENARAFMGYLIQKGALEFMPDRETPDTYYRCILDSTPQSKDGIGYRLREKQVNDYYTTGRLVFREV